MIFILLLVAIELGLFAANYVPGTYLIGWDTIMPEFDLWQNFMRSLFGVWQGYRGLGLPDGMSQGANLLHTFYIFLLSLWLPQSSVRYIFILLTHLLGGIAFYYLSLKLLDWHTAHHETHRATLGATLKQSFRYIRGNQLAAFAGAFLYLFNLGVIQMYFAPLEAFAIHFAALPILALAITNVLQKPTRKHYLWLLFAALLTSPQGFVPTVFAVGGILFATIFLIDYFRSRHFKKIAVACLVLFAGNAFWILPYVYSGVTQAKVIQHAKINEFSSQELFYKNVARGDLASVLSFKGFMLDVTEYDHLQNNIVPFMATWRHFAGSVVYESVIVLLVAITGYGVFQVLKRKHYHYFPYVLGEFVALTFLATSTPVFAQFTQLFRSLVPVFGEVFRFPFTKFIVLYSLCFSILFSFGFAQLLHRLQGRKATILAGLIFLGLVSIAIPAFTGNFFSPLIRLRLPAEYTQTFDYFRTVDPTKRVALFPMHTFWNWQYRSWGYRGSDFLWYGLRQPILLRPFDPWSNYNEQFYNELSFATKTNDCALLGKGLEKYDVSYLLLDQSVINTLSPQPILYDSLTAFFNGCGFVHKVAGFGKISIYQADGVHASTYSLDAQKTARVGASLGFEKIDSDLQEFSHYVVEPKAPQSIRLFPSLFTEKLQEDLQFEATEGSEGIVFTPKNVPNQPLTQATLTIPSVTQHEFLIPVSFTLADGMIRVTPINPTIKVGDQRIPLPADSVVVQPRQVIHPTSVTLVDTNQSLDLSRPRIQGYLLAGIQNALKISDGKYEEVLFIDPAGFRKEPYQIALTNVRPSAVKVVVETFPSSFASTDSISKRAYEIKHKNDPTHPFHNLASVRVGRQNTGVSFTVKSDTSELTFYRDNFFHQASYILFADTTNSSGLPMSFYVDNVFERMPEVEAVFRKGSAVNTIIIPRTENVFQGYGFHFVTKSVGREVAKTRINSLHLYPAPIDTLRALTLAIGNRPTFTPDPEKRPLSGEKVNEETYATTIRPSQDSYVVLSQAYNSGWQAYLTSSNSWLANAVPFLFGRRLSDHVIVDSWANGYRMPEGAGETRVLFFYWPQYFTFIGLGILAGALLALFVIRFRNWGEGELREG